MENTKEARLYIIFESNDKTKSEVNKLVSGFINNVIKGVLIPDINSLDFKKDLHKIIGVGWQWEDSDLVEIKRLQKKNE